MKKEVYIVRSKSGKGWRFKVNATSENNAKAKVARQQDTRPEDYFAYLF